MVRKQDITPLGRGRHARVDKHIGKGATEQTLPSRSALNTLTQGDPMQRTMQNYAKASPMPLGGAPVNTGGDDDGLS